MTGPQPTASAGDVERITRLLVSDPIIGPDLTTWIAEAIAGRIATLLADVRREERERSVSNASLVAPEKYPVDMAKAANPSHVHLWMTGEQVGTFRCAECNTIGWLEARGGAR